MNNVYASCATMCLAATWGCELMPSETLSERTFTTPHAVVRETIVLHPTLHDPVIERRYVIARDGVARDVGGYSDEAREGIETPPFERGGALVIASGAHVAVIEGIAGDLDAARVTWRSPYDAACFVTQRPHVNGHYDLVVDDVAIHGAHWRVRWVPHRGRGEPEVAITMISDDGGRTLRCGP